MKMNKNCIFSTPPKTHSKNSPRKRTQNPEVGLTNSAFPRRFKAYDEKVSQNPATHFRILYLKPRKNIYMLMGTNHSMFWWTCKRKAIASEFKECLVFLSGVLFIPYNSQVCFFSFVWLLLVTRISSVYCFLCKCPNGFKLIQVVGLYSEKKI